MANDPELELDGDLDDSPPPSSKPRKAAPAKAKPNGRPARKAPFGRAGVALFRYADRRFSINPGPLIVSTAARAEEARLAEDSDLIVIAVKDGEGDAARVALADFLAGKQRGRP
jgi:hypothetical protein